MGTAYPCTAYVLGAGSKVDRRQNITILNYYAFLYFTDSVYMYL